MFSKILHVLNIHICTCSPLSFIITQYTLQLWARAFRDSEFHAAVNTNNGTESLNKLLKYSFLPRKKAMTLSGIADLIVEKFLPETYQKYLLLNYKQSAQYRSYKSFIPDFLQGRPRSVIIHSLERRSKSLKYTQDDVRTVDDEGIFNVKGSNGNEHTVSFGAKSDNTTPSCTCRDWVEWHIPCKHFWAVFRFYPSWNWERFPDKTSAYLSTDTGALDTFFSNDSPTDTDSQLQDNSPKEDSISRPAQDEIPKQQVCVKTSTVSCVSCKWNLQTLPYTLN